MQVPEPTLLLKDGNAMPLPARALSTLLTSMGHPSHKHAGVLKEIMGLSYQQVYRKLTGQSGWDVEEFDGVCKKLGHSIVDVLTLASGGRSGTQAIFVKEGVHIVCTADIETGASNKWNHGYVAAKRDGVWYVGSREDIPDTVFHLATRIVIDPRANRKVLRVAVLDDNIDACDTVCDMLNAQGFSGTPYYSVKTLLEAVEENAFDAYVLDWVVPEGTVSPALAIIREANETAPIVILTGMAAISEANANGIAKALRTYKAEYLTKPAQGVIIAATLRRAFDEDKWPTSFHES